MADNKRTVWQNLASTLDVFGDEFVTKPDQRIIIKAKSPEEIRLKQLEIEQQRALADKYNKVTDHGFQKAMQYEAARLPAFLDYEGMEWMPLIASALDLFMEEATTVGSDGKMLKIYSDKERIQEHLEEFFYDIVKINVQLPFWTRNLCKYGNNFVYLMTKKGKGIIHVKQLVNYEMERVEKIKDSRFETRFKQRDTGQEFNNFEIAHFRLLGDDKYLPYGSSVLNKVRRVFRQLVMAEDSVLTYRITRAGEKRVFKIDVGNIDEDDIEEYVQKVMTRFKKQQQVYPDSGQIDYRFNILGTDEDFVVPVRNANTMTGIDVLPGAQNLNEIADVEYFRDNLFTGLGVPKPFLGFQSTAGDGKNMAQMDIRFAKKINRIQQALIQELNKMAMIHLYLLGFDEDYSNFTLSLTNPSTQQDILATDILATKATVYEQLTRVVEGGIAGMSHTNAKRKIFNMSDKEIIEDLEMQRMERAIAQELQNSPFLIPKTGVFDKIDNKYATGEIPQQQGEGGMDGEGMPEPNLPALGGDAGGAAPQSPNSLPPVIGQGKGESNKPRMDEENYSESLGKLVMIGKKKKRKVEEKKIINEDNDKVQLLNNKAIEMAQEIDDLIETNKNNSLNQKDLDSSALSGDRFQNFITEHYADDTENKEVED